MTSRTAAALASAVVVTALCVGVTLALRGDNDPGPNPASPPETGASTVSPTLPEPTGTNWGPEDMKSARAVIPDDPSGPPP